MQTMIDKSVFYQYKKQSCDFIIPLRVYGYLCNDTVIKSANKLRDCSCKFTHVDEIGHERYERNIINSTD